MSACQINRLSIVRRLGLQRPVVAVNEGTAKWDEEMMALASVASLRTLSFIRETNEASEDDNEVRFAHTVKRPISAMGAYFFNPSKIGKIYNLFPKIVYKIDDQKK